MTPCFVCSKVTVKQSPSPTALGVGVKVSSLCAEPFECVFQVSGARTNVSGIIEYAIEMELPSFASVLEKTKEHLEAMNSVGSCSLHRTSVTKCIL